MKNEILAKPVMVTGVNRELHRRDAWPVVDRDQPYLGKAQ